MKPHKGRIADWRIIDYYGGFDIVFGLFLDHPHFAGKAGHTSAILSYDAETGEIETDNSRYTLVGEPQGQRIAYNDFIRELIPERGPTDDN